MPTPSPSRQVRTMEVRALIAAGEEQFPKIITAVAGMGVDESLVLLTPFLPSPLIEKLQSEDFAVRPERPADGSWQTSFRRE